MNTVKVFTAGMLAGIVGLLMLGEVAGAQLMKLGAHMRNASTTVSEFDGSPDQRYVEANEPMRNTRKGK